MRNRITTVTLNAAIDKTYYVSSLAPGGVTRVGRVLAAAGGKGVNVAKVLRQLGHEDVTATGFAGGHNGRFIASKLAEAGIHAAFTETKGESRICLNIIAEDDGASTELLEPGPQIGEAELETFKLLLRELSRDSALVAFSGSLPRGVSAGLYAELIAIAKSEGAQTLLDTSGEALALGVAALPSFVKPNEDEARALLGEASGQALRDALAALMERGLRAAVVTLGAEGAVAAAEGSLYRVRIPRINPVNTVGSGDSFVAGYAYGRVRGWPAAECFRYAAAAGCANALSSVAGDVDIEVRDRLLKEITVEEWSLE